MNIEDDRKQRLKPMFKDGYIPTQLDNSLALGLIEREMAGELFKRMVGKKGSERLNFYVAPAGEGTLSPEEFSDFVNAFTEELTRFAKIKHTILRPIRSGETPEIYITREFSYSEKGAFGKITLYPSEAHVEAVAEADGLEMLQQAVKNIDYGPDIMKLRRAFPK